MNKDFNPNSVGVANGNFFGLPWDVKESDIVLISVPWDVTTSYSDGTAEGPEAIKEASLQVDLFDENIPDAWTIKLGTLPTDKNLVKHNKKMRKVASDIIDELSTGSNGESFKKELASVNDASEQLNEYVYGVSNDFLQKGKIVGIVGGEHSVPFGLIKALSEIHGEIGVLHIDAHADLRDAYEGFKYSHASIMYNVLQEIPNVKRITQVGVRDFCNDEFEIMNNNPIVNSFTDIAVSKRKFEGETWKNICEDIINSLPDKVYISFDIDGLSPDMCPSTGTPVPGGLSFREADYLLYLLAISNKKIIGFDLCEVAPNDNSEWDANVGARVLFKLATYANLKK